MTDFSIFKGPRKYSGFFFSLYQLNFLPNYPTFQKQWELDLLQSELNTSHQCLIRGLM